MVGLLPAVGATAMLAVAAHCGYRLARLARGGCGGSRGEEAVHLTMALAMAAMLALPLSRIAGAALLFGSLACLGWSLLRFLHRPGLGPGGMCVSSVAMAVMVWAMLPAREATPSAGARSMMAGMHGHGVDVPRAGAAQLQAPLLWASLAIVAALVVVLVARRRMRDAVMGVGMAVMLGTML